MCGDEGAGRGARVPGHERRGLNRRHRRRAFQYQHQRRREHVGRLQACAPGEPREQCECIATAMEKHMDKDLLRAAALEVQGKTEEAQKIAEQVGPDKAMASATAAMGPMMQCAMGGAAS